MPNRLRRKSYARIPDVLPLPHLIQVQLESYRWFQSEGLQELFDEISPIESFNGNLELHLPGLNEEINEKLGSRPVPMQIPIGSEDNFTGVIDLIERKAIQWVEDEALGMKYEYCDIPEELVEETEHWRENLVEAVCEQDDDLLERFFEDRESITVEEFMEVTRKAVIDLKIVPVFCGAAFKNKGSIRARS